MNKRELADKILAIEGLNNEEKSELLCLLREQKKYGLVWEDKPEDVEERLRSELPVLTEVKERAIVSDTPGAPNHILIEGDNLEALTALSYTHEGKIDVIYIDPPYNTGNKDFIYNDSYVDKEDSYRHSKWLSFMSKRLKIALQLLSDKGVVFISIGDQEVAQIILLCNEIFTEQNQLGIIPRVQKKGNDKGSFFSPSIDYVLCYARNKELVDDFFIPNSADFPILENEGPRSGEFYEATKSLYQSSLDSRPNQRYYIQCPDNTFIIPPGFFFPSSVSDGAFVVPNSNEDKCWRWSWQSYLEKKHLLVFKKTKKSPLVDEKGMPAKWNVYVKRYEKDAAEKGNVPSNYIDDCINSLGTKRLSNIGINFSFSKPCQLIIKLVKFTDKSKDITILDFFAGSGTTLDATMQLNAADGGNRKCILVTNNENNICKEVTYERNKRVIQGYTTPRGAEVAGLTANNLRYYRTNFVPSEQTNANKRALVAAATDLLCVKNNVYDEQTMFFGRKLKPSAARYFDDGETKMLVIYNELTVNAFAEIIREAEFEGKIKIYVFSNNRYAYNDNFEEVLSRVELCALPAAIYDAYAKVTRKKRATKIEEVAEEFVAAQQAETAEVTEAQTLFKFDEEGGAQ